MGMDQKVRFAADRMPSWQHLCELLTGHGLTPQLRMIDGQPAYPDEQPVDEWTELRVGTAQGMVTLRREPDGIRLVTWGNADAAMCQAWNALTWAIALLSGGTIETGSGSCIAAEFAQAHELPPPINS